MDQPSPGFSDGKFVAFIDHPCGGMTPVQLPVDSAGKEQILSESVGSAEGLGLVI